VEAETVVREVQDKLYAVEAPEIDEGTKRQLQNSRLCPATIAPRSSERNEKDHRSDRRSQKPRRAFALPCQLAADRLAGCRRVDARFTLAFWTLASGRWPFGHWSRRTLVTIGTGRLGARRFGAGWCEKPTRSTDNYPTPNRIDSPDETHRSFPNFCAWRLSNYGVRRAAIS
jgi:hypothetical protein